MKNLNYKKHIFILLVFSVLKLLLKSWYIKFIEYTENLFIFVINIVLKLIKKKVFNLSKKTKN